MSEKGEERVDIGEVEEVFTYEVVNIKCSCCGKMIPAKPFKKVVQGKEMLFCDESCYEFYLDYYGIKPEE